MKYSTAQKDNKKTQLSYIKQQAQAYELDLQRQKKLAERSSKRQLSSQASIANLMEMSTGEILNAGEDLFKSGKDVFSRISHAGTSSEREKSRGKTKAGSTTLDC